MVSDVYIVERLFSSSLVIVVSSTTPQRMNIYHFKKGTEICNYSYPSNILAVKLNRQVNYTGPLCNYFALNFQLNNHFDDLLTLKGLMVSLCHSSLQLPVNALCNLGEQVQNHKKLCVTL